MTRTIVSWNVNGLRQRHARNEFLPQFRNNPDIVCIQEAKTLREKIPEEIKKLYGYQIHCAPVPQGNFTEVMLFSRIKPVSVRYGFGTPAFDGEGRIIIADFETFVLMNIYFPLGVGPVDTLEHKLAFYDAFLGCAEKIRDAGRPVVICGDFSIAHTDDDVESVKKHAARQTGTTVAEREKLGTLIKRGYTDVHRMFLQGKGHYTWWPNGFKIPERHLGRRLDYFYANEQAKPFVVDAEILSGVEGSDHCPIQLEINL
ncbi:MAG: exodeoxyribonuclease III [Methanoregula sp.]|nr:exodeoxyribonuclease III [Methanoregula sp.]